MMSDEWATGGKGSVTRLADPEAALEQLREFLHLQEAAEKYPYTEASSTGRCK